MLLAAETERRETFQVSIVKYNGYINQKYE